MAQCLINIHTRSLEAMISVPVVIVRHKKKKKSQASQGCNSSRSEGRETDHPASYRPLLGGTLPGCILISELLWGLYIEKTIIFLLATLLITLSSVLSNEKKDARNVLEYEPIFNFAHTK